MRRKRCPCLSVPSIFKEETFRLKRRTNCCFKCHRQSKDRATAQGQSEGVGGALEKAQEEPPNVTWQGDLLLQGEAGKQRCSELLPLLEGVSGGGWGGCPPPAEGTGHLTAVNRLPLSSQSAVFQGCTAQLLLRASWGHLVLSQGPLLTRPVCARVSSRPSSALPSALGLGWAGAC